MYVCRYLQLLFRSLIIFLTHFQPKPKYQPERLHKTFLDCFYYQLIWMRCDANDVNRWQNLLDKSQNWMTLAGSTLTKMKKNRWNEWNEQLKKIQDIMCHCHWHWQSRRSFWVSISCIKPRNNKLQWNPKNRKPIACIKGWNYYYLHTFLVFVKVCT